MSEWVACYVMVAMPDFTSPTSLPACLLACNDVCNESCGTPLVFCTLCSSTMQYLWFTCFSCSFNVRFPYPSVSHPLPPPPPPPSPLYAVTANASLHFLGALKALYAGTSNASLHELCLRLGSFKLLPSCAGVCVCPCVCTPHEACMSDVRTRTWALTTCCAHLLLYPVN